MNRIRHTFALFFACSLMSAFAQNELEKPAEPEKLAVYVSGASDAGINKSLGSKLLTAIAQSGKYAEIGDWEASEFAPSLLFKFREKILCHFQNAYFFCNSAIALRNCRNFP